MHQRRAIGRFAIARVDLERLVEAQQRFVGALLLPQDLTELVPGLGEIRLEDQRTVKTLHRLVEPVLLLEHRAEIGKIIGDVRVLPDRLGEPFDGKSVLLRCKTEQAHQVQGIGVVGIEGERLPGTFVSFRQLPGFQQPKSGLEERGRRIAPRSA